MVVFPIVAALAYYSRYSRSMILESGVSSGLAAAQRGEVSPYRKTPKSPGGYASFEAQPQRIKRKLRKGRAFPHCAAAKPRSFIERYIEKAGDLYAGAEPYWSVAANRVQFFARTEPLIFFFVVLPVFKTGMPTSTSL